MNTYVLDQTTSPFFKIYLSICLSLCCHISSCKLVFSVPIIRLRKLKNKFLEVAELGVPCSLVDIVPPFEVSAMQHVKTSSC